MPTHALRAGAVAVALALGVAGCAKSAPEPKPAADRPSVAFVVPSTDLNFAKEMATGFGFGVSQVGGVDFTVAGTSRMDNAGEAKIFEDLVKNKKADAGISVFMQAQDLFAPLIADAHTRNIPMIAVDNRMDATSKVDLFVGNDNYKLGQMLADEAIGKLPARASGDVVLGSPEPFTKGAIAGRLQAQHAKDGKPLPTGWIYTPGLAVNKGNIDEITKRQESDANKQAWFAPKIDEILTDKKEYLRPLTDAP